jgi:hypothetical protein
MGEGETARSSCGGLMQDDMHRAPPALDASGTSAAGDKGHMTHEPQLSIVADA